MKVSQVRKVCMAMAGATEQIQWGKGRVRLYSGKISKFTTTLASTSTGAGTKSKGFSTPTSLVPVVMTASTFPKARLPVNTDCLNLSFLGRCPSPTW